MQKLNDQQRAATEFLEGTAIVVAVPGSGKTLTMIHRIANLVEVGTSPENIIGLTFTKNAAMTMKQRLLPLLGKQAHRVTLSTIHALCYRILRNEGKPINLMNDLDRTIIIQRIINNLKVPELTAGLALGEISLAKTSLISPERYIDINGHDPCLRDLGKVYQKYEIEKDKKGVVDFEDLLTDTYRLLTADDEILDKYQDIFRHVLIDEYQDTNRAQLEIVKILIDGSGVRSLFVVGDDSQTIYSFTGASIDNVIHFKKTFPDAQEFRLTLNYRSTPQILNACRNLISYNKKKIDKDLVTANDNGEKIILMDAASGEDEAQLIANEIKGLSARSFAYKDMVILYRANFQSRAIEESLLKENIPYRLESGQNFYQRREIRCLIDYLQVINDPYSDKGDKALLNILNVPNRYLGNRFKQDLVHYAANNAMHLIDALGKMPCSIAFEQKNAKEFNHLVDILQREAIDLTPSETLGLIRSVLDYDNKITESDILQPDDPKIANIEQLQQVAEKHDNLSSFLEYVGKFQQQQKDKVPSNGKEVRLMTIHKSKGMEFQIVFIAGMVDNILPMGKGDLEEERRIAYVGMSRASAMLHLSYAHQYNGRAAQISPFLNEIHDPCVG